jgi:Family of unknown function (DUF6526)
MNEQNFKNHSRYIPLWHFIASAAMLAVLVGSVINWVNTPKVNKLAASLLVIISIVLFILWWYTRVFALQAQDRAIRAEENFRYFILTGKPLDKGLHLGQIIALRFASDEELPALVKRTLDEKLTPKQIKQAVEKWRADHHRV